MLCSWARYFTFKVPLSTQEYTSDKTLGGYLRWTCIPSRGSSNTPSWLHATESGISSGNVSQFAPTTALPLPLEPQGYKIALKLLVYVICSCSQCFVNSPNYSSERTQPGTHMHYRPLFLSSIFARIADLLMLDNLASLHTLRSYDARQPSVFERIAGLLTLDTNL